MTIKQVDKHHYQFNKYITKSRWASIWHQLDEVIALQPISVLEIGPGPGIFKKMCGHLGIKVETTDIDPELSPDHIASATALPFASNSYDCVCCFQVLEHLPYEQSLQAFSEMARVAHKNIIISLPDAKRVWTQSLTIPLLGNIIFYIPRPFSQPRTHKFDGEHYWEINKKNYPLKKIIRDFKMIIKTGKLLKTYRVNELSYHRFFVFEKNNE